MGLNVEAGAGQVKTQRELAKKGPRVGIISGIIDLGMQPQEFGGEVKPDCREFLPMITLCNDKYTTEDGEERNMVVSPWPIKIKLGDRANYPKFCAAADPQGEVVPDGIGNVFDLVGRAVFAVMSHSEPNAEGIVYANCKGIQELPEDYPLPEVAINELVFNADEPDQAIFDKLYDRTQLLITNSPSWKGFSNASTPVQTVADRPSVEAASGEGTVDVSPF